MAKYLIISPNGYGNIGDDICAYAGKYAVEQVDSDAEVIVSAPPMKISDIKWADYVILSGGGILYDREPSNVNNYMQYIDRAAELGKKSAVLGVGVQGIVTDEGRKRYKESLAKCHFVSVRTEKDKQLLEDAGIKNAEATFDIAYLTPRYAHDVPIPFFKRLLDHKIPPKKKPRIGICMINLKMLKGDNYGGVFKDFDETIESFIKTANEKFDIFLIQHAKEDAKIMRPLAKAYGIEFVPYNSIDDLPKYVSLYESLDMMLGVRLHSIALGIMTGVPTIGIGSSGAKQFRLANYGFPTLKKQFFTFNDISALRELLNKIIESREIIVDKLSDEEYSRIEMLNGKNIELLRQMIKGS